jgi:hypothetical protein
MPWENLLRKLPDSRREPPGLEWRIWKKLPVLLIAGTVIPLIAYGLAHLFPPADVQPVQKHLGLVGILVTATIITVWTAVFTVAIGCFVVRIMKGPAYVADAYPLIDSEEPREKHAASDEPPGDRPS